MYNFVDTSVFYRDFYHFENEYYFVDIVAM